MITYKIIDKQLDRKYRNHLTKLILKKSTTMCKVSLFKSFKIDSLNYPNQ